jgi:hypothetical protein
MRRVTVAFSVAVVCLALPILAEDASTCSHDPVVVHGQKLYESCHCESLHYPDLAQAMKSYGIRVEPSAPVGSDGYYNCGITLRWEREPQSDIERCIAQKNEALDKIDSMRDVPRNLVHLKCSEIFFADICITKGDTFPCAAAQKEAEKRGMTELAGKMKAVKCADCRDLRNDWKKCLDCDGMTEFLRNTCDDKSGFAKDKACSALKSSG